MKILYWNIRGLGARGRKKQLMELMDKHRVDGVCLEETIKSSFSDKELAELDSWKF